MMGFGCGTEKNRHPKWLGHSILGRRHWRGLKALSGTPMRRKRNFELIGNQGGDRRAGERPRDSPQRTSQIRSKTNSCGSAKPTNSGQNSENVRTSLILIYGTCLSAIANSAKPLDKCIVRLDSCLDWDIVRFTKTNGLQQFSPTIGSDFRNEKNLFLFSVSRIRCDKYHNSQARLWVCGYKPQSLKSKAAARTCSSNGLEMQRNAPWVVLDNKPRHENEVGTIVAFKTKEAAEDYVRADTEDWFRHRGHWAARQLNRLWIKAHKQARSHSPIELRITY
jgi:hypothetical protein